MKSISKIKKLDNHLWINETAGLASQIILLMQNTGIHDTLFLQALQNLKSNNKLLSELINHQSPHIYIPELSNALGHSLRALISATKGYSVNPNPDIKGPAMLLNKALSGFKLSVFSKSYDIQSTQCNLLIQKLKEEKYWPCIEQLPDMPHFFSQFQQCLNQFDQARIQNVKQRVEDARALSATKAKAKVIYCINRQIIPLLNASVAIDEEKYKKLHTIVYNSINEMNTTLKQRKNNSD